jgi:uncharacterized membrane protein YidH (DUF202 family)
MGYLIGFLILMIVVSTGVFFYAAHEHGVRSADDSEVTAVLFYYSMAMLVASGGLLVGVLMYQLFS